MQKIVLGIFSDAGIVMQNLSWWRDEMFDLNVVYWFVLKGRKGFDDFHLKGKVLEENAFMVKVQQDSGNVEIIPLTRILDVNEARNTEFAQGTQIAE